jgi:aminomethyltransferase
MSDQEQHHDEAVAPAIETLPLDAWHRAKGARMVEFAGYYMPIQYEGIMAEHSWTRENAGLFDVSHMGQLSLTLDDGSDYVAEEGEEAPAPKAMTAEEVAEVAKALEALVPGDIVGLKAGRMRYSMFLNEEGGILDDLMITNSGTSIDIVVNGAVKWEDIGHLREYLPDNIVLNHKDDFGLLALQGPKAAEALARLLPDVSDMIFMQYRELEWQGHAVGVSRSGYTGEDGFEISVPAAALEAFADALVAMDEVKPIGLGARDSLRLEAGLPLYGHDLDEVSTPIEADLGFAISKRRREEAGFLGSDTVLAQYANGAARKRVGLSVEGKMPVREGAPIFAGDDEIGVVTSGGFAPTVGAPIAMGYVQSAFGAQGTELTAEVRGKRVPLKVSAMPFVPHKYVRKTGA